MMTRSILVVTLAAAGALTAGCGISPKGQAERDAARERVAGLNAELAYDQAWQEYETGQFDKATDAINTAIKLHPKVSMYHLLVGRINLETGNLEQASAALKQALELDPGSAEAHYFLGIVHQRWSDDSSALEEYLAAHEADDTIVAFALAAAETMVALEDYDGAESFIREKLDRFEHNSAMHQLLAQIAMLKGDAVAAADLYNEAWRFDPENQGLLEELAYAQFAAERYDKTLSSIRELIRLAKERRPDLVRFEARCLAAMDRLPEARNAYMEVTRVTPQDVEVWADLGAVAWEMSDYHAVALAGSRLKQLAPERFEGYLFMGINERQNGNLEEAAKLLELAASRSQDRAMPRLLLGQILEEQGDVEAALDAYAAGLAIEPDSEEAARLWSDLSTRHRLATAPTDGNRRE